MGLTQVDQGTYSPAPPEYLTLADAIRQGQHALLTPGETARVLRVSARTIERWRSTGEGPKVTRIGPRRIAYRVMDILEFTQATA